MTDNFEIWKALAGLAIFLIGMLFLEQSIKDLAGRGLKKSLRDYTTTPLKGILFGIFSTALLQSSSLVSLMTIAFVGAGILNLKNAIGIILGSNLGTTLKGWLVAYLGFGFSLDDFSYFFIAIGGILYFFFHEKRNLEHTGKLIFGFGLLFLGLDFLKTSMEQFAHEFDISAYANSNRMVIALVGFVLTAIIQSSSASMVITLSALDQGIISLPMAAAFSVGSDLGTTTTALLGGMKGSAAKKRVALSHFLFNLITAIIGLVLLNQLLALIDLFNLQQNTMQLVAFHSTFNLLGILSFWPFLSMFTRMLEKIFTKEQEAITEYIHKVSPNIAEAATEACSKELKHLYSMNMQFIVRSLQFESTLFHFKKRVPEKPYLEQYEDIKKLEGAMILYSSQIQEQKIDQKEVLQLGRIMNGVRHFITSVKNIKDIHHNIVEFENSSNDKKRALFHLLKADWQRFYLELEQMRKISQPEVFTEELKELTKTNDTIYDRFQKTIYSEATSHELNELEISSLLNVAREVYSSNKNLLSGLQELPISYSQEPTL